MPAVTYRTALVTGASSGIGAALAQRLAAEGTEVVICARRELELQRVAERIAAQGGRSHIAVLDVKEPRGTESAIKQLDEKFHFDLVIANAGVGRMSPGAKLNWDFVEDMINVNVSGSVATLLGALPGMLARGHGHLVGVSSLAQGIGMPRNGTYLATKAFLATFLASLRTDLEPAGIIVTDVRPGIVDTPMSETISNRPFSISAEQAASAIVTGLHQREAIISFPYPAKLLAASFRVMPGSMFRSVMRWMDEGE
jgi:short-subunit dehydrogenase